MQRFWNMFQWVVDGLKTVGMACLVGMTFLTCVDVVGRFFGHPVFGSVEIVGFMATLAVASGLVYTHQMKGHIGVEILVRLFPRRVQTGIELGTNVLSLALFGLIAWRMADYAATKRASGEVSMSLEFPEFLIIYAVAFCFLVFFLQMVRDIVQNISALRNHGTRHAPDGAKARTR